MSPNPALLTWPRPVAAGGDPVESSLFTGDTPTGSDASGNFNLGTIIRCNEAGEITALRFWRANAAPGRVARLYVDGSSTAVREVTDTGNTIGWAVLPITPYAVTANQIVMAAHTTGNSRRQSAIGFFSSNVDSADGALTGMASTTSWNGATGNGRYTSTVTALPNLTYSSTCYYCDLILTH